MACRAQDGFQPPVPPWLGVFVQLTTYAVAHGNPALTLCSDKENSYP